MKIDYKLFTSENTGGGCIAYRYPLINNYFLYVTNDSCSEITFMDNDIVVGLYRNINQLDSGDAMKIWNIENIFILQEVFDEAFIITQKDYIIDKTHDLLDDEMMVIEYTEMGFADIKRYLFDLRDIEWSIESSIEVMHRELGHSDFTVTKIFQ